MKVREPSIRLKPESNEECEIINIILYALNEIIPDLKWNVEYNKDTDLYIYDVYRRGDGDWQVGTHSL